MKTSGKVVFALAIATVGAFLAFGLNYKDEEERGAHLTHVGWLPAEASDVTFVKSGGFGSFTCFECTLPKEAFDRFARKENWTPEPRSDVSNGVRHILGLPAVTKTELGESDSVPKALFYEKRQPNGAGVTVIYDLDRNRLFVQKSSR